MYFIEWPTEGDRIFEDLKKEGIFSAHYGWQLNDSLAFNFYISGYYNATKFLLEYVIENIQLTDIKNTLIYPIMFLFRHYTELILKDLYLNCSGATEEEINEYVRKKMNHNLIDIWNRVEKYLIESCDNDSNEIKTINIVKSWVKKIQEISKNSIEFRYPIENKTAEVIHTSDNYLDYYNLLDKLKKIDNFYYGAAGSMSNYYGK